MIRFSRSKRARRRGVSLWLFVATLPLTMGICGMVIDIGQLHARRAQAQRAADAAALAGAIVSGKDNSLVLNTALQYAKLNGYDSEKPETRVVVTPNYNSNNSGSIANTVRVWVAHDEPVYFAPIAEILLKVLGWNDGAAVFSHQISASAVAQKKVNLSMNLGGTYGIGNSPDTPTSNTVYGPNAYYNWGDPYSTKYLQNGTPNPRYEQTQGYSDYTLSISPQFLAQSSDSKAYIQIFDPDCFNPKGLYDYDELRAPNPKIPGVSNQFITDTQYEIYKVDGPNSLRFVASATYGADASTDQKWVTPGGFNVDLNAFGTGEYRIRVKALSGSSENAFQLRAGPAAGLTMDDATWNNTYGDKKGKDASSIAAPITSDGRLLMNFARDGTTRVNLGYVDSNYAGKTVDVSKFDVDVGSQSITYTLDNAPDFSSGGLLPQPADGVWSTDTISIPSNFTGGNIYAEYVAGAHDTSAWELSGSGEGSGNVRLIE